MKVWVQKWEESERGWGVRPDGYTIHVAKEDINRFLMDIRKREQKLSPGRVPDTYSLPSGEPYEAEIPLSELQIKCMKEQHGLWADDNNYPKPIHKGADNTGWVPSRRGKHAR